MAAGTKRERVSTEQYFYIGLSGIVLLQSSAVASGSRWQKVPVGCLSCRSCIFSAFRQSSAVFR